MSKHIETTEKSVVDGNNATVVYYDDGTYEETRTDKNGVEVFHQIKNEDDDILLDTEYEFYGNSQLAKKKVISKEQEEKYGTLTTETQWREDGEEIYFRISDQNNEVLAETNYEFYENGKLKSRTQKNNMEYERLKKEKFFENGQPSRLYVQYRSGSSNCKTWYDNGQLAEEWSKRDNGEMYHQKCYYATGQLSSTYEESFGKAWTEYYENGVEKSYLRKEQRKVWGSSVYSPSEQRRNYPDGTKEYEYYRYNSEDTERYYNKAGICVRENAKIDSGWGKRTKIYDNDGKLQTLSEVCDNCFGGGGRNYSFEQVFDEFERLVSHKDNISGNFYQAKYYDTAAQQSMKWSPFYSCRYNSQWRNKDTLNPGIASIECVEDNGTKSLYKFDEQGRAVSALVKGKDGHLIEKATRTFDGESIFETSYTGNGDKTVRELNIEQKEIFFEKTAKDGKIVEKREYDVTSVTPVKIFEISTNENGGQQFDRFENENIVERKSVNPKGKLLWTKTLEWDGKFLVKEVIREGKKAETEVRYKQDGWNRSHEIFYQRIGAFGHLMELREYHSLYVKSHEIKTLEDGTKEETRWNEEGKEIFYNKLGRDEVSDSRLYHSSGKVRFEMAADGSISYWDNELHAVREKYDANGNLIYKGFESGNKEFELTAGGGSVTYWDNERNNIREEKDGKGFLLYGEYESGAVKYKPDARGMLTTFYESGEVLAQAQAEGGVKYYFKSGNERFSIDAAGNKRAVYDEGQVCLINGRHCDKVGEDGPLSAQGVEQAKNIGKFLALAYEGKIAELPNIVLPEVYSHSQNSRTIQTCNYVKEGIEEGLGKKLEMREYNRHKDSEPTNKMSFCSIGARDIADGQMGSVAVTVANEDAVVDRVIFTAEQIAQKLHDIEMTGERLGMVKAKAIAGMKTEPSKTETRNISFNTNTKRSGERT